MKRNESAKQRFDWQNQPVGSLLSFRRSNFACSGFYRQQITRTSGYFCSSCRAAQEKASSGKATIMRDCKKLLVFLCE
ncbi:MAG: hypothetical protein EG822_04510 [Deltaproteobacteria bacterium]|nr:hypothetical protein [Deltaproteobacteria bacterium]TLN01617.1 MAG: hypothetical protein FDZ73_15240 [bacterium]